MFLNLTKQILSITLSLRDVFEYLICKFNNIQSQKRFSTADMERFLNFGSRFRIGSHRGLASGSGFSLGSGSSFGSVIPALAAEK